MTHFATAQEFPVVSANKHEIQKWDGTLGHLHVNSGGTLGSAKEGCMPASIEIDKTTPTRSELHTIEFLKVSLGE